MTITYGSYLKLHELLALQQPVSRGPSTTRRSSSSSTRSTSSGSSRSCTSSATCAGTSTAATRASAQETLKRILTILKVLVAQIDVLETMTPISFNSSATGSTRASGFQSAQFREVEFMLGRKRASVLAPYPEGSRARRSLERRLDEPSIWDAFLRFLARQGHAVPGSALERDAAEPTMASSAESRTSWSRSTAPSPWAAELCERLVDLDEGIQEWRYRHVKMVERTIGTKRGTGGSAGAEVPAHHPLQPALPRSLGDPHRAVTGARGDSSEVPALRRPRTCSRRRTRSRRTTPASASRSGCCSPATRTRRGPTSRRTAQQQAWDDAAELVDGKWDVALEKAHRVRRGFAALLGAARRRHRARRQHARAAGALPLGAAAPRAPARW